MAYTTILVDTHEKVGVVTLNRPEAMNALSPELLRELLQAMLEFDTDGNIGAIVIAGSKRVFAAGADIKFMANASAAEMRADTFLQLFDALQEIKKPVIAAVSGYALGGGCELALFCDMIIASETARFGQPEVTIGIIPGAGGTQRLVRAVGKAIAMEMILNNRLLSAVEAMQYGLVNKVVPVDSLLEESLNFAASIARRAPLAVAAARHAVNEAFELSLSEGLVEERNLFNTLFDTEDQKEGMLAFIEKRQPSWLGR